MPSKRPPHRGEFGRHPAVNDKAISKTAMAATAADVMLLGAAMGFAVVVMKVDPNKATIEHAWASTPELNGVVDDVDRVGGPLPTACRKMRGEQQLVVENDNGNEGAAKRKRRDGAATRQEILWAAVGIMKTRFGTLPGPATAKSEVKVLEEELRLVPSVTDDLLHNLPTLDAGLARRAPTGANRKTRLVVVARKLNAAAQHDVKGRQQGHVGDIPGCRPRHRRLLATNRHRGKQATDVVVHPTSAKLVMKCAAVSARHEVRVLVQKRARGGGIADVKGVAVVAKIVDRHGHNCRVFLGLLRYPRHARVAMAAGWAARSIDTPLKLRSPFA